MRLFLKGFSKKAAESSFASDFMGGVDPTGLYTFNSAKRNAQEDTSKKRHGAHRAIATAGGIIGGGAVVGPAIPGLIQGATDFFTTPGGLGKRLAAGGKGLVRGFKKPFKDIRHGLGGGKKVLRGDIKGAQPSLNYFKETQAMPGKKLPTGNMFDIHRMPKEDQIAMGKRMQSEGRKGFSALGLSGGIAGTSAYLQYGGGRSTGDELRRSRIEANQAKKQMRGR